MSTADDYKKKGNDAFAAKAYKDAIEHFSKAIELDGNNHVLFSNRSAAHASLQEWQQAFDDGQKCVSLNAGWAKGYIRLGAALHGLRKYDEAITAYNKGLEVEPTNETLKSSLAAVQSDQEAAAAAESGGKSPFGNVFGPDTISKIMASPKLRPFLSQPDYVNIINQLVANPNLVQMYIKDERIMHTWLTLAGVQLGGGEEGPGGAKRGATSSGAAGGSESDDEEPPRPAPKPATAAKQPAAASSANPGLRMKEEGNALYKQRKFDEALAKYDEAIAAEPNNSTYRLNRTAVLFEQARFDECLAECDTAIDHGTEHKAEYQTIAKLMTRKASCLQKKGNFVEAIALFKKALLEWRNPETLSKLDACEREKKQADITAYLDPAIALKEKEEGNALFKQDKFPEAVARYSEAIKRNPSDHTVYSNRAAAYLKLCAYDDAIRDCESCLAINPTFVKALSRKGAGYFWVKQYYKAMEAYEAGLKIDPANAECLEGIERTRAKIFDMAHSGEKDEEASRRAMSDPEIQAILGDTYMQMVLQEMQRDPQRLKEYMRDPNISAKLNKLIAAGVLRFGSGPSKDEDSRPARGGRR